MSVAAKAITTIIENTAGESIRSLIPTLAITNSIIPLAFSSAPTESDSRQVMRPRAHDDGAHDKLAHHGHRHDQAAQLPEFGAAP
jgi:hypothetical protein